MGQPEWGGRPAARLAGWRIASIEWPRVTGRICGGSHGLAECLLPFRPLLSHISRFSSEAAFLPSSLSRNCRKTGIGKGMCAGHEGRTAKTRTGNLPGRDKKAEQA
jgi:hypothetical protein